MTAEPGEHEGKHEAYADPECLVGSSYNHLCEIALTGFAVVRTHHAWRVIECRALRGHPSFDHLIDRNSQQQAVTGTTTIIVTNTMHRRRQVNRIRIDTRTGACS
jgi:hypothetical protein